MQISSLTSHSRLITWLKIALPSIAAIFIFMILLIPRLSENKNKLKLSTNKIATSIEAMTIENARFLGVNTKGQPFTLNITHAVEVEKNAEKIEFENPVADITFEHEKWLNLNSKRGVFQKNKDLLTLSDDVLVLHADGYSFTSDKINIDIKRKQLFSDVPVTSKAPIGDIKATGGFNFINQLAVFKGPVKINLFNQPKEDN